MPSVTSFDDPNPPFYPPPEWLSESPARPPPSHPGSTPRASPNRNRATEKNANEPRNPSHGDEWRQTPTGATARQSSRSASATGPATPAATHISYPKARLGLFHPTSMGGSIRDQNPNRYSTRTRNMHYSTPTNGHQQNGHENTVDRNQLLSPVPPPPANLHTPQAAAAFSVDPGVPFLATAGPTEDGSDDEGENDAHAYASNVPASMRPGPGPRNLVGGLVSGIRSVVRKSTMRRRADGMDARPGFREYEQDRDRDYEYDDYDVPQRQDEPPVETQARSATRDSGYAPSTPQYDDAPAPTPAQPTPASLYAKQIQDQERREEEQRQREQQQDQRDRRRGAPPVSPIARDYVRGAHPSPHRLHQPQHTPAQTQAHATPRARVVVDPDIDEYDDDPEAVPFTYTPPGVPPQARGYTLHDPPVPSVPPPARPSRLSRPPPLPLDPPTARPRPNLNLLSPDNADTQTPPLPSPVSATPHYAPDYAQMNLPTSAAALAALGFMGGYGLGGAAGLKVYARKVKRGWEAWRRLPWVVGLDDGDSDSDAGGDGAAGTQGGGGRQGDGRSQKTPEKVEGDQEEEAEWRRRVTWDYYPQRERRRIGRMGVKGGKGGVWRDDGKENGSKEWDDDDDTEDGGASRRAHVPAIVWRSAHYRVSLDEAAMPFVHGRTSAAADDGFQDEEGAWDEWHDGAWDSNAHGDPNAGSHYHGGGRGNESDPDGWMDIRPLNQHPPAPRWNVVITPQRRSYADVNLGDEFEAVTPAPALAHTPLPMNPPGPTPGPPPGGFGPLPMYPPGQAPTPAVPSGPMPYYPPAPPAAAGGSGGGPAQGLPGSLAHTPGNGVAPTPVYEPPPIEPIGDEAPAPVWDRLRGFPPPLLPRPRPPHQPGSTRTPSSAGSVSSPTWSRPPPGQPPGTYAPMPLGFEDRASMRRSRSQAGQTDAPYSPSHSHHSYARAPSQRSGYSHISTASRPPPGQPPGTYDPFHANQESYPPPPPPGAMQRQGSAAYAPSARSRASSQRSRPPPGQPPGTYPPFDDEHAPTHRREPAHGYTPSRASSHRSRLPPPPPGQPPGTYPPHLAYTPSHASQRSHASRLSRTSHASSNPFRPPPGQPPGTYPPFHDEFTAPRGEHGGGDVEEDEEEEEGSYDDYTPTPAPRGAAGTAPSGGAQSSRSHISTRSHRLLQTPGPASARSLAARELADVSDEDEEDEEDGEYDHGSYLSGGSGTREVYPQGYVPYEDQQRHQDHQEEIDWRDPRGPGGPGYGDDSHLTFREALALRERRQRPQ